MKRRESSVKIRSKNITKMFYQVKPPKGNKSTGQSELQKEKSKILHFVSNLKNYCT